MHTHLMNGEPIEWAALILRLLNGFDAHSQALSSPLQEGVHHWHLVELGILFRQGAEEVQNPHWTQPLPVPNK